MSLYYEAAAVLTNTENPGGSLKSRVYGRKDLKGSPAQIYALVSEATKWSAVLKEVVENSNLLKEERKLTPTLAILLTHDLLLSKGGVAAAANHALKLAINRHKARLNAEFMKARLRRGFGTIDAFRAFIEGGSVSQDAGPFEQSPAKEQPRWARINTLRTSLEVQLATTFAGYKQKDSLADMLTASPGDRCFHVDRHVPSLLALPPKADMSKTTAYQSGELILQDKASCFPAYLLNVEAIDGDVVDACAAPGNKTTHLAAIVSKKSLNTPNGMIESKDRRILAYERDKQRSETLKKMVKLAGADNLVSVKAGQDFLNTNPEAEGVGNVGALLLDPSCSGSGIVGRDDSPRLFLPSKSADAGMTAAQDGLRGTKQRKRKRAPTIPGVPSGAEDSAVLENEEQPTTLTPLTERLTALSAFQLRLLEHAMRFPSARKITYSTCSIHAEENESVVIRALHSSVARQRGWRILRREEQVEGMRRWNIRGDSEACKRMLARDSTDNYPGIMIGEGSDMVAEACIRCEKGTEEGTMGFFVAAFVRDVSSGTHNADVPSAVGEDGQYDDAEEEEWEGFSNEEDE